MKKYLLIILAVILSSASIAYAAPSVFNAFQVGTSTPTTGYVLQAQTANGPAQWVATSTLGITGGGGGSGTVTSVSQTVPTGFSISGSPVTTSGTLGIGYAAGFGPIPLTASTTQWATLINGSTTLPYVTSIALTTPAGLSISGSPITSAGTLAITLTSGFNIPLTASTTQWSNWYNSPCSFIIAGSNITCTGTSTISSTGGGGGGTNYWTIGNGTLFNSTSTDLVGIGSSTPDQNLSVLLNEDLGGKLLIGGQNMLIATTSTNLKPNVYFGGATPTTTAPIVAADNLFFGSLSGGNHTSGSDNIYLGSNTGALDVSGADNVVLGVSAGANNATGTANTFVGEFAGFGTTGGSNNTFLGLQAGFSNKSGSNNSALGRQADFSSSTLNNANVIGQSASGAQSETVILGAAAGTTHAVQVGIGTSTPNDTLSIVATNGINPFVVGSSTGAKLFEVTQSAIDAVTHQIHNVVDPTSAQDAATKNYVDSAPAQNYKQAATSSTVTALPTNIYNNGVSGVGATLTGVSTGAITIDGNNLTAGDRILVKNEATAANNGIYVVTTPGSLGVAYILTRATDFNTSTDINTGDAVFIVSGTTNKNTVWSYTGPSAPTIGTTNITFAQTGGGGGTGTVTSVDMSVPTGLSISGNPITSAGTLALSLTSGFVIPLTASTTQWSNFFNSPCTYLTAGANITCTGTSTIASTGGGSGNSAWTLGNGFIYNATSTDAVGIGTSTPSVKGLTVDNGTIYNTALMLSTSTNMTIFVASSTWQTIRMDNAAATATISIIGAAVGMHMTLESCNSNRTGANLVLLGLRFYGGIQPSNSTATSTCDDWFISVGAGTTTPPIAELTGMVPQIQ